MSDRDVIWQHVRDTTVAAAKGFGVAFALAIPLGLLLAIVSGVVLRDRPLHAVIAVLLVLAETVAAGIMLGTKRAVIGAILHGVRTARLGGRTVQLLFDRLMSVPADAAHGDRGNVVTRTAERLPLAQAESRLNAAVTAMLGGVPAEGQSRGWIARRVERVLVRWVRALTLADFRKADAAHGGVDLLQARDALAAQADEFLVDHGRDAMNRYTLLILAGFALLTVIQTPTIRALGDWLASKLA